MTDDDPLFPIPPMEPVYAGPSWVLIVIGAVVAIAALLALL